MQVLKYEADAVLARLHAVQDEVDALQQQTDTSSRRLRSAETLTSSLGDERVRWGAMAAQTDEALATIAATALMDAAALTHLGPLTHAQRCTLVQEWKCALVKCGVPGAAAVEQWTVASSLGDDMELRKWFIQVLFLYDVASTGLLISLQFCHSVCNGTFFVRTRATTLCRQLQSSVTTEKTTPARCELQGLPSDDMSITSAILTVHSQQVPLCIDPHQQAESWLRYKLAPELSVVSATEPSMLRVLQHCAKVGSPCLVTSVANQIDPALLPFISWTGSGTEDKSSCINTSKDFASTLQSRSSYAPGFELYLTTQLKEPCFASSMALSISFINYAAYQAVWEQLLVDTVRHEKPSLEASADALASKLAFDTRALRSYEEQTLHLLQVCSPASLEPLVKFMNAHEGCAA